MLALVHLVPTALVHSSLPLPLVYLFVVTVATGVVLFSTMVTVMYIRREPVYISTVDSKVYWGLYYDKEPPASCCYRPAVLTDGNP